MIDKHFKLIGSTNHSDKKREDNDFYSTPRIVTEELIKILDNIGGINGNILECACGTGAISKVLKEYLDNEVISKDLIDRGYGDVQNFFDETEKYDNIITNPPFKYAKEFIEKALELANNKVIMLSKIQLLEGKKRYLLFKEYPPKYCYVFSYRTPYMRGDVEQKDSNAMCLAWFIWEKGYKGDIITRIIGG